VFGRQNYIFLSKQHSRDQHETSLNKKELGKIDLSGKCHLSNIAFVIEK
jgi:hypothetical protein